MYTNRLTLFCLITFLSLGGALSAQSLVDGSFNAPGRVNLTAGATFAVYDEFYVGEMKTGPVPAHGKISQQIYSLYGTVGITENLTVIASVPYITSEGEGMPDPINDQTSVSGVQDVSVYAKYRPFSAALGENGRFDGILAAGVSIAGGYEPNGILSIGSGANAAEVKVGGVVQATEKLSLTALAGYIVRGEAENTGDGADFDVPNGVELTAKLAYNLSTLYLEGWVKNLRSTDGVDIMGEGFMGNFPETDVDLTIVGASAFVPVKQNLGFSLSYGTVVSGRNVGDGNYVGGGVTVGFGG